MGGQLEGLRPEADGADYHRGDSGRGRRGGGRKSVHPAPLVQVPELRHKDTGKLPHKAGQPPHGEVSWKAERRRVSCLFSGARLQCPGRILHNVPPEKELLRNEQQQKH